MLGSGGTRDHEIVERSPRQVDMHEYADRNFQTLSGGEKQRVILARALSQEPAFLVLDEPANRLGIKYQLQVLSTVERLGIGVLAALHDLSMAAAYCDELYVLKKGAVVTHGPPGASAPAFCGRARSLRLPRPDREQVFRGRAGSTYSLAGPRARGPC